VQYVPPDGFFCIQIVQNSISAGAMPRTPLGELTMLHRIPYLAGNGDTPPHSPTLSESRCRRLRRRRHLVPSAHQQRMVAVDANGNLWIKMTQKFNTLHQPPNLKTMMNCTVNTCVTN